MEKAEAYDDGAKLVKNSGRGYEKGDAKLGQFLVDYKFNAKTFTITSENWSKLNADAFRNEHRHPLIVIKFEDGTKLGIVDFAWVEDIIGGKLSE
jgi:hypothetical protein